ncbi:MAG: MarR family winged helix-turn-helix transcriptional regulator [Coriobacteriia bacterium]|nr:MarR family winged helix-turn-helix transcriptional regulator [Coriobacteriia bacterium]
MDTARAQDLLDAWMHLTLNIRENRFLNSLSFNEMAICHLLEKAPDGLTAAQLCHQTRLLKSQMNKELANLEAKDLIAKVPSAHDKRKVLISLSSSSGDLFEQEHARVMDLFSQVADTLGPTDSETLARLLHKATNVAETLIDCEK